MSSITSEELEKRIYDIDSKLSPKFDSLEVEIKSISEKNDDKKPTPLQQEVPSTYINFYFCKLSLNIMFTFSYMIASVSLNIINRVVFYNYKFLFNFSFLLLPQIFCIIFFIIVSKKSETFKQKAGEISFQDFKKLKWYYLTFAAIFTTNNVFCFYGTQLIINAAMFHTLRKLVLVMVYFYDVCFDQKRFSKFTNICAVLVIFGSVLTGIDTFSRDYLGIIIVLINNTINTIYIKFTEKFKKSTGVTNLKLLVYNSYLSGIALVVIIFVSGEFSQLMTYFKEEQYLGDGDKTGGTFSGLMFFLFLTCFLVIVLNTSFFISNEKNSPMFTILLSNSKDILTSVLSYFFLEGNKFTFNIAAGLLIATVGAVMFSLKSICDNIIIEKEKTKTKVVSVT